MGSPWMVGNAPGAASYAAPLVNFGGLAEIPEDMRKAQQYQRQQAMQNLFQGGLPKDATGQPDIQAMATRMIQSGGSDYAKELLPFLWKQQELQKDSTADLFGVSPSASANNPPAATSGPTGPGANPTASGPANNIPQQPKLAASGADIGSPGADTIRSIATELAGGRDATAAISNAVRQSRIGPDMPLTPDQAARLRSVMGSGGAVPATPRPPTGIGMGGPPGPPGGQPEQQAPGGAPPAGATAQPAPAPPAGAGAPSLPPGYTMQAAVENERRAAALRYSAQRRENVGIKGDAMLKQADDLTAQAKQMREAITASTSPTPEQKQARDPVIAERAAELETQKSTIVQSQKTYNGLQAQSTQYERDLRPYLDLSRSLLNSPDIYTGAGGKLSLDINRVRAAFGDQKAAMLQEALQKVTATSVLGQINQQRDQLMEAGANSGRIFSQQVDLVEKAAPQMATTIGGNRFLVEVQSRMGDLQSRVTQMARDYMAKNRGVLGPGFDQQISEYMRKHPVFTSQELAHPELLGSPTGPPNVSKAQLADWGHRMGLKSGDPIRTPNGDIRALP